MKSEGVKGKREDDCEKELTRLVNAKMSLFIDDMCLQRNHIYMNTQIIIKACAIVKLKQMSNQREVKEDNAE